MENERLREMFNHLSTPLITDACIRLAFPFRMAPSGIKPLVPDMKLAGRIIPVRHYGSVDVFLEAMINCEPGDVLVIDNGGRMDEGCIGDLTVLEAKVSGLSGIIVWGCHRDSSELRQIHFPVFSHGTWSVGPQRLDPQGVEVLSSANLGDVQVDGSDVVFADEDGVVFLPEDRVAEILIVAQSISQTERDQAREILLGNTLKKQLKFEEYLEKKTTDPSYTFRVHLKTIGGAIEE